MSSGTAPLSMTRLELFSPGLAARCLGHDGLVLAAEQLDEAPHAVHDVIDAVLLQLVRQAQHSAEPACAP